jgi:hypothetical protein
MIDDIRESFEKSHQLEPKHINARLFDIHYMQLPEYWWK